MAEAFTDRSTRIPEPLAFEERYEVVGLERPTPTIVELWLRPLGEVLDYLPGEYVLLEDRERTVPPRSFSIANAPRPDGLISLLATRVAGGHNSAWIHERLRVGQEVSVSGPYGTFVEDPAATDPAVFLAAGSGLAPIRALLEAGLATHARSSLTLIFSARSEADVIDRELFQAWQSEHPSFRFIRTLTRGAGPPRTVGSRRCCPPCREVSMTTTCSSPAPPHSCSPARRPPTRSEPRARGCTRRCSSSSPSRGRVRRLRPTSGRDPQSGRREAPPIYTMTGDDGTTGLLFGGRVSKADPVVEVCGTLDEAVAAFGLARAALVDDDLRAVVLELQRGLFAAGAEIAANPRARDRLVAGISSVNREMTAALERHIDRLLAEHPLRPAFVVPGATPSSAALDLARTVLRRAERRLVAGRRSGLTASEALIAYVNRASDLAYVLARRAADGHDEPVSHE